MIFRTLTFVAALAVSAFAGAARADVVYQSIPDLGAAPDINSWCSDCYGGTTFEPLDPFTLSSNATITGFNLMAQDYAGYSATAPITVEIYNGDHTAIIFSQAVNPTFVSGTTYGVSMVTSSLSGLSLAAGSYWIGFIGESYAVPGYSGGNGGLIDTTPHTGIHLFDLGGNLGYQLLGDAGGAVPEPATWALMIGGFGLAGATLRRRKTVAA